MEELLSFLEQENIPVSEIALAIFLILLIGPVAKILDRKLNIEKGRLSHKHALSLAIICLTVVLGTILSEALVLVYGEASRLRRFGPLKGVSAWLFLLFLGLSAYWLATLKRLGAYAVAVGFLGLALLFTTSSFFRASGAELAAGLLVLGGLAIQAVAIFKYFKSRWHEYS